VPASVGAAAGHNTRPTEHGPVTSRVQDRSSGRHVSPPFWMAAALPVRFVSVVPGRIICRAPDGKSLKAT